MASCKSCGGAVKFDIEEQKLKCTSCGSLYSPYENDLFVKQGNDQTGNDDTYETTAFICPQCGGELCCSDHDLSGNCAFCGTPVVFEPKQVRHKRPELIIPFGVTKDECREIYAEAVEKNPFAPKELRDPEFIDGFRGIYVPYWVYDVRIENEFKREGTRTEHHRNYSDTFKDEVNGQYDAVFSHIMHDASSVLQDDLSEKVEPFEAVKSKKAERRSPDLKEFSEGYFPGFYAEPADVEADTYKEYAENIAADKTASYLSEHSRLKKYGFTFKNKSLEPYIKKTKLAMMPVWFLSYRKNNRVAYAAVNGQTGRIVSDMPVDFGVFAKRFFIAAAVIFLILMLCTILPVSVTLLSVITSFIVTCYCFDDISSISEREKDGSSEKRRRSFSDGAAIIVFIAVISVYVIFRIAVLIDTDFVTWINAKFFSIISIIFNTAHLVFLVLCIFEFTDIRKDRTPAYVICPIINFLAGAAGGLVLLFAPALDAWYYLAGSAVLFTEMISFLFIIKNYNRKATRPLPQFSVHKGGDDSAR
ncbi:MAG: hypothetical protein IKH71_02815 [Oscillospiraceae bacterium]|nr:hypothetical protein [Oscillospiraceae bacterium]